MTNVLLIVADDMRADHLPYMPAVRRLIQAPGRTFRQARCNVALCQPNRVGLLTGQLSREHGELGIGFTGSVFVDHDNGLGAWAAASGTRNALLGKYINYYDSPWVNGIDAPKGWDMWRQLTGYRSQVDYDVKTESDSVVVENRYQTEYLSDEARAFVRGDGPWFCYLAPYHPHSPFSPHPMDLHGWSQERCRYVPLQDVSAKPPWVQAAPPLSQIQRSVIQQEFRGRLRELSAVDRMAEAMIAELEAAGTLDDTVVIFTADNGVHQGEQRRGGDGTKAGPYDPGLRVPLVVRGPGFAPGPPVEVPVYPMQDVTATILDVLGATAGLPDQAGISLRTIAADPAAHAQRVLLHEIGAEGFDSTGDGVTTGPDHELGQLKLFRYPSARSGLGPPTVYELYDLAADPDELENLADVASFASQRAALDAELDRLLAGG